MSRVIKTCVLASVAALAIAMARAQHLDQPGSPATPLPRQLTLVQAETLLLERSLAIASNRYQLQASQALRLIAGYKPNPVLQLGGEQILLSSPEPTVPRFFATDSNAGANPVWTAQFVKIFERGGKRELRIAQADAVVDAARAQILDTYRTQLFQLRQAFAAAILARENLRLAGSIDQQYARTEELTVTRVKEGDLAGVETYRVRAGRLPFRQALLDAQTAYQQAARDVLNLLGVNPASLPAAPDTRPVSGNAAPMAASHPAGADPQPAASPSPIEIVGSFSDRPARQTLAELHALALANRPDVAQARANLRAAERAMLLAQSQRHRDISVAFEYQRVGYDNSAGVVAQIPLFLYNNQKAGIAQAVAQQHAVEMQVRQVELQAITDVEKAYQVYLAAQRAVALYSTDNLVQVERLRTIAEFSYRSGATSLLELLDAQRTASQASVAYNQARANYQLSLWQLEQAIGRPLE